jgi:hypothetical protein
MKLEYNGRFVRFRLEFFPSEPKLRGRMRLDPATRTLAVRRRLLRQIDRKLRQIPDWLENT